MWHLYEEHGHEALDNRRRHRGRAERYGELQSHVQAQCTAYMRQRVGDQLLREERPAASGRAALTTR